MKQHISVVIPTYNGQNLLAKHLPKVAAILEPGDEILIVDDASTDNTIAWLTEVKTEYAQKKIDLNWVEHSHNQRFAAAVNTGVEAAQHPWIFLLNNDVTPLTLDIRSRLLRWFETTPRLFAVGCGEVQENRPDAPLFGRGTGGYVRGFLSHHYDPDQKQYATLWTAGGSMFFAKKTYQELGGMDTIFAPAYQEDRDLSYRALKQGWNLIFDFESRVWHQHETTNESVFGQRLMEVVSWKNQFLIVWKNITDPAMMAEHLMWLPFHLVITNWKTKGLLGKGFWQAIKQLGQVRKRRQALSRTWKLTDRQVLEVGRTFAP
jgi:GT2 family glycosyltransferase